MALALSKAFSYIFLVFCPCSNLNTPQKHHCNMHANKIIHLNTPSSLIYCTLVFVEQKKEHKHKNRPEHGQNNKHVTQEQGYNSVHHRIILQNGWGKPLGTARAWALPPSLGESERIVIIIGTLIKRLKMACLIDLFIVCPAPYCAQPYIIVKHSVYYLVKQFSTIHKLGTLHFLGDRAH